MSTTSNPTLAPIPNKRLATLHGQYERKNGEGTAGLVPSFVPAPCGRCCGQGGSTAWNHTGYYCYRCGGTKTEKVAKAVRWSGDATEAFVEFAMAKHTGDMERAEARRLKKEAADQKAGEVWAVQMEIAVPTYTENRETLFGLADTIASELQFKRKLPTDGQKKVILNGIKWAAERAVKDAAHAAKSAASEWVGEVKERLTGIRAKVERVNHFETQWGMSTIWSLRTMDGNALKWFSSSCSDTTHTALMHSLHDDDGFVLFTGTVKEHTTYKEEKQTALNRCKAEIADKPA